MFDTQCMYVITMGFTYYMIEVHVPWIVFATILYYGMYLIHLCMARVIIIIQNMFVNCGSLCNSLHTEVHT